MKWFSKLQVGRSETIRSIAVLMTGTLIAQLASYAFSPILTRLYTPEEMGEFGIFMRIVAVGSALTTLKWENAIPVVSTDRDGFRIYLFTLKWIIRITIVFFCLSLLSMFHYSETSEILFFIFLPLTIFATAFTNLGTAWSIRKKEFKSISMSKSSMSILSSGFKILFALSGLGYIGLIIGQGMAAISSNFWFFRQYLRKMKTTSVSKHSKRNTVLALKYDRFPKVNLPHVLMDYGRDLLLALIIVEFFSKFEYGSYDHAYKMLRLPLIFVGAALGQVFFQKFAEKYNNHEDITVMLVKALKTLLLISIVPFTVLFFFGETLFEFVFGENWAFAGRCAEIMCPWLLLNFLSSPFSNVPLIINRQKEFFGFGLLSSVTLILGFVIPYYFFDFKMENILWVVSVSQSLVLIFVIYKTLQYSKVRKPIDA